MKKELDAASNKDREEQQRREQEGEKVKQKAVVKDIKVEYLPLDLSSLQSTIEFVRIFKERNLPLHLLINNAGIAFVAYSEYGYS